MEKEIPAPSRTGAFLRNGALYIVAATFLIAWLPLARALIDGPSYEWGIVYYGRQFAGAGTDGDFGLLVAQGLIALVMLHLGFRAPSRFSYFLLSGWLAFNAGSYLYGLVTAPEALIFEGETLGVAANIGLVAFALYGGALLGSIAGAQLEFAGGRRPPNFPWTRANSIALLLALALFPVQIALLRAGEPHGRGDEIGVLLTMAQWALIVFALAIGRRRR